MKKLLVVIMLMIHTVVFGATTFTGTSEGVTIYYELSDNNEYAIVVAPTNNGSYSGDIVIPETVSYSGTSYTVKEIGAEAFSNSSITSISLSENIETIGSYAFAFCASLTAFDIPSGVTELAEGVLGGSGLTAILIPKTVTSIGDAAFMDCESLKEIYVESEEPAEVVKKGSSTYGSFNVSDNAIFYIPSETTEAYMATDWSDFLTESNVVEVDYSNFEVDGLFYAVVDDDAHNVNVTYSGEFNTQRGTGNYNIEKIEISETVVFATRTYNIVGVGEDAFYGCSSLVSVTMGDNIETIGKQAFYGTGLTTINIPEKVPAIESGTFCSCESLTEVNFATECMVESIGDYAFQECASLTSFIMPASVTKLGVNLFFNSGIESFSFEQGTTITELPKSIFESCGNLVTFDVPDNIKTIADYAFESCTNLTNLSFPEGLEHIANNAFEGCNNIKSATIYATEPPELSESAAFSMFYGEAFLKVPPGSYTAYNSSNWANYFVIYNALQDGIYYGITDGNEAEIVAVDQETFDTTFTLYSAIEINGEEYKISSIAEGVFADFSDLEITIENEDPSDINIAGAFDEDAGVLNVPLGSYTAYKNSDWANYFEIEGYDAEKEGIYYVISGENEVEIVAIDEEDFEKAFTLYSAIEINDEEYKISSIAEGVFADFSDLEITIENEDPSDINIAGAFDEDAGVLNVPLGSYTAYKNSDWANYFEIEGYDAEKEGIYYVISGENEVEIVAIDEEDFEKAFTLYSVIEINGQEYKISSIAEGVFVGYTELVITIENEDPSDIKIDGAFDEGAGVLNVPTGCVKLYEESDWAEYFEIEGDYIMYDGVGYSYVYVDGELKSLSDHQIALEVSYIGEEVTEVTIPRTINLGEEMEVEVVSISQELDLKELQNLTKITLEADIPAEDATALQKVPEGITVAVPADRVDEYEEMFKNANIEVNVVSLESMSLKKIESDRKIVEIYNIVGQRVSEFVRGINVVKYSDGVVEKVLVK